MPSIAEPLEVPPENGGGTNVVFPPYRDPRDEVRHGCHHDQRLREASRAREAPHPGSRREIVERRAEAIALSKEEEIGGR